MMHELSRRHYKDRPLAKLSEEELGALITISRLVNFLAEPLAGNLGDLSELASLEDTARDLEAEFSPDTDSQDDMSATARGL